MKPSKYKYPCDIITATLIVNNFGSYDDIMKMSFEGAIKTYACLQINFKEQEELYKNKKK